LQGGDDLPGRFNPAIFPAAAQALFFLFKTGRWLKLESDKQPTDYPAAFFRERMGK